MNTDETIQLYRVKEVRQWNTNGTVNGTQLPIASADLSIIVCKIRGMGSLYGSRVIGAGDTWI